MRCSLLIAIAISISACASTEPPTTPQPITSHAVSAADYPPESVKAEEEGATTLRYIILENGTVGDVQILKSSGFSRLDQASVAIVKSKWRFKPATQNGRPVKVSIPAQIVFALSPTRASYMLVAPEHAASETEMKPGEQALITQIHRIYDEVEQRQAALPPPKDDAERLVRMGEIDQAARYWISLEFIHSSLNPDHRVPTSQAEWAEINRHDLANQAALKAMLPPEGWFLKSRYGQEAVQAAFEIVYHAVNDKPFQRSVLTAIQPLIAKGEIRAQAWGMLYDRVATEDGGPQRYGTVFTCQERKLVLAPLEDPEHVNLWRTTMGFSLTAEEGAARSAKALPCT